MATNKNTKNCVQHQTLGYAFAKEVFQKEESLYISDFCFYTCPHPIPDQPKLACLLQAALERRPPHKTHKKRCVHVLGYTYMLGYSTYIHIYIYFFYILYMFVDLKTQKLVFFIQPLTYICFRPPSSTKCARSNIHYRIEIYVFPNMQICMATSGTSP